MKNLFAYGNSLTPVRWLKIILRVLLSQRKKKLKNYAKKKQKKNHCLISMPKLIVRKTILH